MNELSGLFRDLFFLIIAWGVVSGIVALSFDHAERKRKNAELLSEFTDEELEECRAVFRGMGLNERQIKRIMPVLAQRAHDLDKAMNETLRDSECLGIFKGVI